MSQDYTTYGAYERLNAELAIYRDLRTKKQNYVARILLETGGYKLKSLRTGDQKKAVVRAQALYDDIKLRERRNLPMSDPTVRECLNYWLREDGARLTERRRQAVTSCFARVFEPFINDMVGTQKGLETELRQLRQSDLKRFATWRTDTRRFPTPPSYSTLALEVANFNVVIRCAKRNNLIDQDVLIPTLRNASVSIPKTPVRPSANTFTRAQIDALSGYLKRHFIPPNSGWNRGICKLDENDEVVRSKDGAVRSKNSMYLSRVNLYCSFFILLNTGIRLSELYGLRWQDLDRHLVDHDAAGRERHIYILRVNETKPFRKAMSPAQRIVIGPSRLQSLFDLLRRENPHFSAPKDFVINTKGRRKRSQQPLFEKVQACPQTWGGQSIDCSVHSSGTTLDLRHLRSYYVSKMLIDRAVPPQMLVRQTGHSLDTIIRFYLTSEPMRAQKLTFGGWAIDSQLVQETMNLMV